MAIIKASGIVGGISGNLGGICFVNGRGSKVVRTAKPASKSRSSLLAKNRGLFATFQRQWRTLTEEQQTGWRTYANATPFTNRLGESTNLSGFQMYVKIQVNLFDELGFFSDDPPIPSDKSIQEPITVSSTVSGGIIVNLPAFETVEFTHVRIKAQLLWTDSVPKFAHNYSHIELISFFSGGGPVGVNITNAFEDVFSLPILNQVVAFRTSYASLDHTEWSRFDQLVKTSA